MFRILLVTLLCMASGYASAANESALLFGVNEGSSGSSDFLELQEKYRALTEYLAASLKKQVYLESASDLKNLARNLQSGRYDLLLVRPGHVSAKAIRDNNYTLVAAAKGNAYTYFIVHKDSPIKKLSAVHGKRIAMPDKLAYPTSGGIAMLRDAGIKAENENIQYFRSQDAVGYAVKQKLVDVGVVVSYSKVAKEWVAGGDRILAESQKLPYWAIVASPKLNQESVALIRAALIKLADSAEGEKIIKKIGINGFVPGDQSDYMALLDWLKE